MTRVGATPSNDIKISREEIFGPVVPVMPFKNEDDAIRLANDTDYGLAAGIQTFRSRQGAEALESYTQYKTVWANLG